jgi:4-carboxymuconolactone decarboxylase
MVNTPRLLQAIEQGQGGERLPLLPTEQMNDAQRAAAQALINGPRKAAYGPFVPLLHTPVLLERVAQLGEALRFGGQLSAAVRELVTALVAQRVGNQFEWVMHAPLAQAAGISAAALEAVRQGHGPIGLAADVQTAYDFCSELMATHEVSDSLYGKATAAFGEAGVVELSSLIGYFVMVSWLMNVARTPSRPTAEVEPLP